MFQGVMIKQSTQLKIDQNNFSQFAFIELLRELEISPEKPVQDEFESLYKLRAQAEQKMQLGLNQILNSFMYLTKKQYRKIFNTKIVKHFYQSPQIGYQLEQHPLMSLFTLFTSMCAEYKLQLTNFFTLAVRLQIGFSESGDLSENLGRKVQKLSESVFVDSVLQGVINLCQLITEFVSGQKNNAMINAVFDLIQFFNAVMPVYMGVYDFQQVDSTHQEELIQRGEIKYAFQLGQANNNYSALFEQKEMTPCKLIKIQFQKTFSYLQKCGQRLQAKLDYLLFQPIKFIENTLVVPQASIILSQLQQLQQFTHAWQILGQFKPDKTKLQIEDDSDDEQPEFDFTTNLHLNFQLTDCNNSLEKRILYTLNLITKQPQSEIYLLQKLNTVGYIYEYFQDISTQISNLISQSLKDFTLHFMYSLVQQYRIQIWEPVCRRLKPNLLGEALVNVFQKWCDKKQYDVKQSDVEQIKQYITGFQTRKEQINIKAQDENSNVDELSGESTIQGLDIDQVTESGFSVNETEIQQKFKVQGLKVKSKRIKTIIGDNLSQFYKQFEQTMKFHKGFYCISRNLNKKLKQTVEQTALAQLEFYQNVCYATLVSQRYFEGDEGIGMVGLVDKVREVFGE